MGKPDILTLGSILGAMTVLVGFVLVNVGTEDEREHLQTANGDDHDGHETPMELSIRSGRRPLGEEGDDAVELRDGPEHRALT